MRDRDVRNAIQTTLVATGAFDGVWIWGMPDSFGTGSTQLAAAAIEPVSSTQSDRWDSQDTGGLIVMSRVAITFLYRHDDPQIRDEGAELLVNIAGNAINGQSLAGLTLPGLTRIDSWTWAPPTPPERRIKAIFSYQYIVEGWGSYDATT
jgi:hypothetical protein